MHSQALNRTEHEAFLEQLRDCVKRSSAAGRSLGLLIVDIERLSALTARLGYNIRFGLLTQFARRLRDCIRPQDSVVRLGEGRFAVIVAGIMNEAHATLAANKILRTSAGHFNIHGRRVAINIVMGISVFPEHARHPERLLQKAELALEGAREAGERIVMYSDDVTSRLAVPWELEAELEEAVENGEFELYYQPKVRTLDRLPCGAEALMRWHRPARGFIPPDVFIPLADRTGHIHTLTKFAINTALRQAADWSGRWGPLSVSVNVTPNIVQDPDVIHMVSDAHSIWGSERIQLVLEVTEGALMEDPQTIFATLREIKEKGIGISIDDFGTGYSSLAYFKDIPADELKIDKSFVFRMLEDPADERIVRAVINLAHGFDLSVVAEGVENAETLAALAEMQCDLAQGYYLAKPIPQRDFIRWLETYRAD